MQAPLLEVLEEARTLGFLGPGPVEDHLTHATGFRDAAGTAPGRFLDLGSGGGVPGLALAAWWPEATAVLLDGSSRRTAFLRRAVATLGWRDRVAVVTARAEAAGHDPALRAAFDLVTARGFGPPPVTAECGAAFLRHGGRLLVSDPPDGVDRWDPGMLEPLGLVAAATGGAVRCLLQERAYPPDYPRRRPGG